MFHLTSRGAKGLSADGGFTEYLRYLMTGVVSLWGLRYPRIFCHVFYEPLLYYRVLFPCCNYYNIRFHIAFLSVALTSEKTYQHPAPASPSIKVSAAFILHPDTVRITFINLAKRKKKNPWKIRLSGLETLVKFL